MSSETLTNAGKKSSGLYRPGIDKLVDGEGKPVKLMAWNLGDKMYFERVRPIANDKVPETISESVTVIREVAPIFDWKPAEPRANEEFSGCLVKNHPKLKNLSDEDVDEVLETLRHGEPD
jgi:hypothetical protein